MNWGFLNFKKTGNTNSGGSAQKPFAQRSPEEKKVALRKGAERFNKDFGSAIKQLANE